MRLQKGVIMTSAKKIDRPASQSLIDFMEKETSGEYQPRYPDAEPPVFITEEMEAEALARGDTSFTDLPIHITRSRKD